MAKNEESSDSDRPIIDDNVIRIQLRKPSHRKWELRTRNLSLGIKFPTIQLFDSEGNLLVETNDENISIKSSDFGEPNLKGSQSLRETDYRHIINPPIRKRNSISEEKIYTRIYKDAELNNNNTIVNTNSNSSLDLDSTENIPSQLNVSPSLNSLVSNQDTAFLHSEGIISDASSYKSSDNDNYNFKNYYSSSLPSQCTKKASDIIKFLDSQTITDKSLHTIHKDNISLGLQGSQSFNNFPIRNQFKEQEISVNRSQSGIVYKRPQNKIYFLNTYLRSLATRRGSNPDWFTINQRITNDSPQNLHEAARWVEPPKLNSKGPRPNRESDNNIENEFINNTKPAEDSEIKNHLKMYRRGISEIEARERRFPATKILAKKRRHSLNSTIRVSRTSSSESVDDADVVLNRLKRRIAKNKIREKRRRIVPKPSNKNVSVASEASEDWGNECGGALVRSRLAMGSNISQHSSKGLKGRRVRSSGDLCNGETKSQTESSVCGSVVGESMGWNRSLPNHLDGNRHLADYSRVNNNYGEFASYRCHPKGGRGLRYRISKSGSDAEPVWKLQDPGFDQGYGSERSPEDDCVPPIPPAISLEEYEAELRAIYPFITDENTFTVIVEKDGRGLGMSVCGGGGLVRIRRLYPPQPAWKTGKLAQKDLLLSANGVPLAGLSTYEALEVLRTAAPKVELRVCRPPPDVLESITPPDPPTPPARTPHPQHLPLDPLNCHPLHARLSQTTSSATTSSSEGRGKRDASPEDRKHDLHLPDLDRPLPVYDIQYGEFDIVMTKVNGSLGFTLRKEDHSALGHYVRALVREPALSDARIQPGDRIVAVNDTPMSNMSHAEAVAFLRACDAEVRLRLYRDHAATPLSPMSPKEEGPIDADCPITRPKPPLRAEAVSMLCDLAARRLTPDATDGSRSPCLSPRKYRKLTKDNNHYEQPNDLEKSKVVTDSDFENANENIEVFEKIISQCSCTIEATSKKFEEVIAQLTPNSFIIDNDNMEVIHQNSRSEIERPPIIMSKMYKKSENSSNIQDDKTTINGHDVTNILNKANYSIMQQDKCGMDNIRDSLEIQNVIENEVTGKITVRSKPKIPVKQKDENKKSETTEVCFTDDHNNMTNIIIPSDNNAGICLYENINYSKSLPLEKQDDCQSSVNTLIENGNRKPNIQKHKPIYCTCNPVIKSQKYPKHKDDLITDNKLSQNEVRHKVQQTIKEAKTDNNNCATLNNENDTKSQLKLICKDQYVSTRPPLRRASTQRFCRSHSIRKRLLSKRFKSKTISGPIIIPTQDKTVDDQYKNAEEKIPQKTNQSNNPITCVEYAEKSEYQIFERPNTLNIHSANEKNVEIINEKIMFKRPALTSPTTPPSCRDQKLSLTVIPQNYELNNLDNDTLDAPNAYQEDAKQRYNDHTFPVDSDEPVSMPVGLSSDEKFKHSNPAYQSAVLHSSTNDSASDKDDGNGLKKWKALALSPDNERKSKPYVTEEQPQHLRADGVQKENIEPVELEPVSTEPTIVSVELNRGWNSRLGFSVQSHPESGQSYISAVYNDSVAARDGRLRRGDVILQVNDENVTSMKAPEVIDLLRILRGSICITVLRPPNSQ